MEYGVCRTVLPYEKDEVCISDSLTSISTDRYEIIQSRCAAEQSVWIWGPLRYGTFTFIEGVRESVSLCLCLCTGRQEGR